MAAAAERLLSDARPGQLILTQVTLAEVVWVLSSFYRVDRKEIAVKLMELLANEALISEDREVMMQALALYGDLNIAFADAMLATRALIHGPPTLYSFDRDFDRVSGVTRVEPM
jgi:predicted nucleic-acid-binding protein